MQMPGWSIGSSRFGALSVLLQAHHPIRGLLLPFVEQYTQAVPARGCSKVAWSNETKSVGRRGFAKISSQKGLSGPEPGCLGKWLNHHRCRYLKDVWMGCSETKISGEIWSAGLTVGLDHLIFQPSPF